MNQIQINALKRITKNSYPQLQGMFIDNYSDYCFCDSFRVVKFYDVPVTESAFPLVIGCDLERALKQYIEDDIGQSLTVDIALLRTLVKEKKCYDFGRGLSAVNSKFLLDMLRIFPGCEIYAFAHNPERKALFFKHKLGEGYLLPIRKE